MPRAPGPWWRSLKVRLALVGAAAIYVPVLLLFGVTVVNEEETVTTEDGTEVDVSGRRDRSTTVGVVVALAPVAAALGWWWAARAVRPIERVRAVADVIEASDLSRRIALAEGTNEVVALARSFDAMLDRLEAAAGTQRRLIEEASHELRTPLSLLRANAEVLLAHPEPTLDVYRAGLERSRAAATRLQGVIDELLVDARGRARTLDRRPADLAAVAHGVVDEARVPAAARDVDLVVEGPASLPCPLDEPTVRRAIANLVDNAVRHAPAGTAVTVTVAGDDAEAAVTVADHGPGVPADQQERVFERFWRAPGADRDRDAGSGSGSGLGLPIARQVARAHGGDVTVTSPGPDGDGAVFTLTLRR
ncbi:MAG TPA: HAMP domain-containing sensor histidine kinase [Acidimicrobiales bacterium]